MPRLHPAAAAALRHSDRVIFAGFALALAAQVGAAALGAPSELRAAAAVGQALARLEAHAAAAVTVPSPEDPRWAEALAARLDPARVPPAAPAPPWLLHRRPKLLVQRAPEVPPVELRHAPAAGVAATCPAPGRVLVRWAPPAGQHVRLAQRLERRLGDDGPWTVVADGLALDVREREDRAPPRARAAYRVVSTAVRDDEDPAVVEALRAGRAAALDPALVERASEASAPVEVRRDRFVVVRSVTTVALHPERGAAYLAVHVWDAAAARFAATTLTVEVGGRLTRDGRDLGGALEEVEEGTRPGPRGWDERVGRVRVRWDDGAVEEVTDKDVPAELRAP